MKQYTIEHGSYYLRDDQESLLTKEKPILLMCDQIGIAYMDDGIMLKHGDHQDVKKYAEENGVEYIRFPRGFPVEEINRCMANSQYLAILIRAVQSGKYDHLGSEIDTLG